MNPKFVPPLLFAILLPAAQAALAAPAVEVSACGQTVTGNGVLVADLDCSVLGGDAIILGGGRLDLDGHTVIGRIQCTGKCEIAGPGQLHGSSPEMPVVSEALRSLESDVVLLDLTVTGGIESYGRLTVRNSTIDTWVGGGPGRVLGFDGIAISDSTISGTVHAYDRRTVVTDSDIHDGTVRGYRVTMRRSILSGGTVIGEKLADVRESSITTPGGNGVQAHYYHEYGLTGCQGDRGKVRLLDSTVVVEGTGWGVFAGQQVGIQRSTVVGGSGGVYAGGFRNGCYIYTLGSVTISDSVIEGGVAAVVTKFAVIENSSIIGWEQAGVYSFSLASRGLSVSSANRDPECGTTMPCPDIATQVRPTGAIDCSISRRSAFGGDYSPLLPSEVENWGICTED